MKLPCVQLLQTKTKEPNFEKKSHDPLNKALWVFLFTPYQQFYARKKIYALLISIYARKKTYALLISIYARFTAFFYARKDYKFTFPAPLRLDLDT